MSSYSVDRCRWRRRVGSARRRPPNNGTQHTARGSSRTSLSSSERLDCSKSVVELHCSKSIVELRGTVDDNSPARNSRAHANCFELCRTRMFFLREATTPHRRNTIVQSPADSTGELVTSKLKHRCVLPHRPAASPAWAAPTSLAQSGSHAQYTRAHQKLTEK